MAFKVTFDTLAIIGEDAVTGKKKYGNVSQGIQVIYTDMEVSTIEGQIIAHLEAQKLIPVIKEIKRVPGTCLL